MNTTQATQLRVGNLFRFISTDSIEQVADIRTAGIKTPTINNVLITDIEPIPLNEDWLVRFGFEVYEFDHKENQYRFKERLIVIRDGCFIDYGSSVSIKYVHTLQNLIFALTGTELTLTDK